MFRRVISIVFVCASLFGLAHPLMACAAAMQTSDCCTGDPASGCTTDSEAMLTSAAGAACCTVAPAVATQASALPARSVDQWLPTGGSNGPVLPTHFDDEVRRGQATCSPAFSHKTSIRPDASLTYLRTARLRL